MITVTTVAEVRTQTDAARAPGSVPERQAGSVPERQAGSVPERQAGGRVGFVPTMGYFHQGHRSLMRAARADNDLVVVSLFVNPTQFGPHEDLTRYPRDPDGDAAAALAEGVDVLFVPAVDEIYPDGACTTVHVNGLTRGLCGASRPIHFDGVTTVVAKLFSIVGPCRAYFGRKDAQQLAVVRRMAADLGLPVDVVGCPLVREPDGLAMSSRNAYLSAEERAHATVLSRALRAAGDAVIGGVRDAALVRALLVDTIADVPAVVLDYAEVVDAHTLQSVDAIEGDTLVAVAAVVGTTRLIDNITIEASRSSVDFGVTMSAVDQETP